MNPSYPFAAVLWVHLASRAVAAPALGATELTVFPAEIRLGTAQAAQSVAVQALYPDGTTRDVTTQARFTVANTSVARIDSTKVWSAADGKTEITVQFDSHSLKVPVTVEQAKVERPISFKLDVIPAMTKAGCNSGACHGASRGKDG